MRLQHLGLVLRVIPNARQCLADIATSLARKESRTPAEMECETRKSLEQDWRRNIDIKQEKRQETKEKERDVGILVQDQCKRYHRCQQCKRGLRNRGSCNIWTDTFYLPGSRYII